MRRSVLAAVSILVLGCAAPKDEAGAEPGRLRRVEPPPSAVAARPQSPPRVRMLTGETAAPAATAAEPRVVTAQLVSEFGGWRPGATQDVGVHLVVAPGWHVGWSGAGGGEPLRVKVQPPAGFTVGEVRWPTPERLTWPDGRVDHVYRDDVTLLIPVTVPEDVDTDDVPSIRAWARWQARRLDGDGEPDGASLTLSLPVLATRGAAAPTARAPLFEVARSRLPPPLPSRISASWDGTTARFVAPGADRLDFVPAPGCVPLDPALVDHPEGELMLARVAGRPGGDRLLGLLEVTDSSSSSGAICYRVDLRAP